MAKHVLLFLCVFSFLFICVPIRSDDPNPIPSSAYEELKSSGFPVGLLPTNVIGYSLNRTTGDFVLHLDEKCQVTLPPDNYLATYSPRIVGRLLDRHISNLDGISVRAFFRWWSITGIRSADEDLVFEVGVASAKYPSRKFGKSPDCEGRRNPKKADS